MKAVVTLTKKFFDAHPALAGQPTGFANMVRSGKKIHTCRQNFLYWSAKIEALKAANGVLCIREWSGRPYRSPQDTIIEIPASAVGVERLVLTKGKHHVEPYRHTITYHRATVEGKEVDIAELARNDGFDNAIDYTDFFKPLFDEAEDGSIEMAILHFTTFRYGSKNQDQNDTRKTKRKNQNGLL